MKKHPALFVFLLFLTFIAGALAPAAPRLWAEAVLSANVRDWAISTNASDVSELALRSRVQALARKNGFHLEFEDIVVQYRDARAGEAMPVLVEVGYTLPMELPLFGFLPWRIVAVRIHPFRGAAGS